MVEEDERLVASIVAQVVPLSLPFSKACRVAEANF